MGAKGVKNQSRRKKMSPRGRGVARVENREGQIIFKGALPQEGRSKGALSVLKGALMPKEGRI